MNQPYAACQNSDLNLTGSRILVTGATGFVGRHLCRALVLAGAEVTCLTRASSRCSVLPPQVRIVQANLSTGEGLPEALAGQEVLIHMAALLFGLDWHDYLRSNTQAAQCMAAALARHGTALRRCVLLSSLAATGPCAISPGVDDSSVPSPVSAYGWSKYMTEQLLGQILQDRLVILRPPIIYGSGDMGLLPCFQAAAKGWIVNPGWGRSFPVSAVHVRDMVQAIILSLKTEARGVYHLNDGAEYSMTDIGQAMATALHRKAKVLTVPLSLMGVAAQAAALWGNISSRWGCRAPSWNPDKYREARQDGWLCQAGRIRQELGYSPTVSLTEGMAEAVAGYKEEGLLP